MNTNTLLEASVRRLLAAIDTTHAEAVDRRGAMPAGHPISWGAITAGTVLEGTQYPLPVF